LDEEWRHLRVPFIELLGAQVDEAGEGYSTLSLLVEERHTNPNGVMHGGVAAAVMDSAAAVALGRLRGERIRRDNPHATVEMNVSLISAARPGDELVVEGRVLKLGRSVAFCESEARRRADNELIAKGRFTFAIRS
jgi:acyl-coenzyme A thioesterase 13